MFTGKVLAVVFVAGVAVGVAGEKNYQWSSKSAGVVPRAVSDTASDVSKKIRDWTGAK